jgi:hypothetical protein
MSKQLNRTWGIYIANYRDTEICRVSCNTRGAITGLFFFWMPVRRSLSIPQGPKVKTHRISRLSLNSVHVCDTIMSSLWRWLRKERRQSIQTPVWNFIGIRFSFRMGFCKLLNVRNTLGAIIKEELARGFFSFSFENYPYYREWVNFLLRLG